MNACLLTSLLICAHGLGFFPQIFVCFCKCEISCKMLQYNIISIGDSVLECTE